MICQNFRCNCLIHVLSRDKNRDFFTCSRINELHAREFCEFLNNHPLQVDIDDYDFIRLDRKDYMKHCIYLKKIFLILSILNTKRKYN